MSFRFYITLILLVCSAITACSGEKTTKNTAKSSSPEVLIVNYLDEQNLNNGLSTPENRDSVSLNQNPLIEESGVEKDKDSILIAFINKHLSSHLHKYHEASSPEDNHFVVTSPIINSLPLFSLASAGVTKAQVDEHIPIYQIPNSLKAENKYEWQQDAVVYRAFLRQLEAIIEPKMERIFYNKRSTRLVLVAESVYNRKIEFTDTGLAFTPFKGRYLEGTSAYEADMIKLVGDVSIKETPLYTAKQTMLDYQQLSLTAITPKDGQFSAVIKQLNTILSPLLADMKNIVPSPQQSLVIPEISMQSVTSGFHWISGVDIPLAFSEQEANLTKMGLGGFYFDNAMGGKQRIFIDSNGISIKAKHTQYIYGSEENNFFSDSWSFALINEAIHGVLISVNPWQSDYIEPFEPDFKPSILLLHDSEGYIQAAMVIKKLDGNFIGNIASYELTES